MIILSSSTQYFQVAVKSLLPDGSSHDPTSDSVSFAFLQGATEPGSGTTWEGGTWFSGQTPTGSYVAQILVGPAGLVLPIGSYNVFLKITDDPEVPVMNCGPLVVQ